MPLDDIGWRAGELTVHGKGGRDDRLPLSCVGGQTIRMLGVSDQASQHIDAAFALWRRRSAITWDLDLNILIKANITVTKPPSATERADLPGKFLRRI